MKNIISGFQITVREKSDAACPENGVFGTTDDFVFSFTVQNEIERPYRITGEFVPVTVVGLRKDDDGWCVVPDSERN